MPVTWEQFERFRQKGLDARRAMQWDSARLYLLEAARTMTQLAKDAQGDELRAGRDAGDHLHRRDRIADSRAARRGFQRDAARRPADSSGHGRLRRTRHLA